MSFSDELRLLAAGSDSAFADAESRRIAAHWLECGSPEDMWNKLLRANEDHLKKLAKASAFNQLPRFRPRLNEKQFIQFVLSARHGVEGLIAYESKVKKQFEDAKKSFVELIKLADSPREIEGAIEHFRLAFESLDKSIYDFHATAPVSRKDQNGSRTKKAFALRMQQFFEIRCGRPMREIITQLMDIVFSGEHSEDVGRIARRATTTAARTRLKR
jgi:hypothetical protein